MTDLCLSADAGDAPGVSHVVAVERVFPDQGRDGRGAGHLVLEGLVVAHGLVALQEALGDGRLQVAGLVLLLLEDVSVEVLGDVGGDLGAAMQKSRVWRNRQGLVRSCISRHQHGDFHRMLKVTGRADAAVKGRLRGDPWHLAADVVVSLAA